MDIGAIIGTVAAITGKVFGVLYLLLTPFLSLGSSVFYIASWPLRLLARFLAQFENILIFLSVAVLVGMISGLVLYSTCTFVVDYVPAFILGPQSPPSSPKGQRREANDLTERDERKKQQSLKTEDYDKSALHISDFNAAWDNAKDYRPSSSTILEEEETSQGPDDDSTVYSFAD